MKKTSLILVSTAVLILTAAKFTNVGKPENIDSWIGTYQYEEHPVKANAGYAITMVWNLVVYKEDGAYKGILEVNGQQTFIKLSTAIAGNTDVITVNYDHLIDGSNENLKSGNILFTLSKGKRKLNTKWSMFKPRLSADPPKECECFLKIKNSNH